MAGAHIIYLVVGTYSDYEEQDHWVVCWRQERGEAEKIVALIEQQVESYLDWHDRLLEVNPDPDPDNYNREYTDKIDVANRRQLAEMIDGSRFSYVGHTPRRTWGRMNYAVEECSDAPVPFCVCTKLSCICENMINPAYLCPHHGDISTRNTEVQLAPYCRAHDR